VPYTAFNLPFAIWILRNYMLGIPKEMEETGRIDGAGPLRTVWSIVLPQALPGLFTAGIFCFTACWTEFLMALTFNIDNNFRTIPVGIACSARLHVRTGPSSRRAWSPSSHRHPGASSSGSP
jgi:multiple sugar transport system permease protein